MNVQLVVVSVVLLSSQFKFYVIEADNLQFKLLIKSSVLHLLFS